MPKSTPDPLAGTVRPKGGYLRQLRTSLGLSLQAVADPLDVSPQAVHQFEKSEAAGTISLRQFNMVARAMGYRIAYGIEPIRARRPQREAPADAASSSPRVSKPVPESVATSHSAPVPERPVSTDWFAVTTD